MAMDRGRLLTYEDYLAFPDDGIRREIVEGKVYELSAPTIRHQDIVMNVAFALETHVRAHGGGRVWFAPLDVRLSEHDIVQPDVIFVAEETMDVVKEKYMIGSPTLLVEVVSDPRHDRVRKRRIYARAGVPVYWIVDPAGYVEAYRLEGSDYGKPSMLEPGERLNLDELRGFSLDVAELFSR